MVVVVVAAGGLGLVDERRVDGVWRQGAGHSHTPSWDGGGGGVGGRVGWR